MTLDRNQELNPVAPRRLALLYESIIKSAIVFQTYLIYLLVRLFSVKFDLYKLGKKCLLVKLLGTRGKLSVLSVLFFQFCLLTFSVVLFINNYVSRGNTLSKSMLNNTDLSGKVALVTGGYSGIGYETVLQLLKWNCKVVICGRNKTKATNAIEKLKQTNSFDPYNVSFIEMDLDDLLSVKKAAELFLKNFDRLDFLINNAGVYVRTLSLSKFNIETNFSSNFLGHFYLTQLLLDIVKSTGGRILNMSSIAHFKYDPNTDPILENKSTNSMPSNFYNSYYGRSKLYNIWFTHALQRRMDQDYRKVLCLSMAPGVVITPLMMPLSRRIFFSLPRCMGPLIMKRPVDGAATTLYLCAEDQRKLIAGAHYDNRKLAFVSKYAHDYDREEKLYSLAQEFVKVYSERLPHVK